MPSLADRVKAGERAAIARALTVVERKDGAAETLLRELWPATGRAVRVGVTGAPGVGKSTLVDALAGRLADRFGKVGVLAVDPTSPFTAGALLGDRIRMQKIAGRDDVFVRSAASRGRSGGLSPATGEAADVFDAAGYAFVLVETVGVGQGEWEVCHETDLVLVLLAPGAGDGIQALKAGLMEIADVFVVTKADLPGAEAVQAEVEQALMMRSSATLLPVVSLSAVTDDGLDRLVSTIDEEVRRRTSDGSHAARARRAVAHRMINEVSERARAHAARELETRAELLDPVLERKRTPGDLVKEIMKSIAGETA